MDNGRRTTGELPGPFGYPDNNQAIYPNFIQFVICVTKLLPQQRQQRLRTIVEASPE